MNTKIIELLNVFSKMSGESEIASKLNDELNKINELIPKLNDKLNDIKATINDDKYFDASSEIIDRNLELSLKKKLGILRDELKKLEDKNNASAVKSSEKEFKYKVLHENMEACQRFINLLNTYKEDKNLDKDDEVFETLIHVENARYEALVDELNKSLAEKEENNTDAAELNEQIAKLKERITNEEDRLKEVTANLSDKKTYIDERAKEEDLNKVKEVEKEIIDAKIRRNEILDTITYRTENIKDRLLAGSITKEDLLDDIHAIVNKLNELPYLNMEDEVMLKEELNQLNSKKDELTAIIENKVYNSQKNKIIEQRKDYLKYKSSSIEEEKKAYENLLQLISKEQVRAVTNKLLELKSERDIIAKDLDGNSALEHQKRSIDELIKQYESDLAGLLNKSADIKQHNIVKCDEELEKIKQEDEQLDQNMILQNEIENIALKERDNKLLENTIHEIDCINNRLSCGSTPNQIQDQIEMLIFENNDIKSKADIIEPIVAFKEEEKKVDLPKTNTIFSPILEAQPEIKEEEKPEIKKEEPIIGKPIISSNYTFEKVEEPTNKNTSAPAMTISQNEFVPATDNTKEYSFSPIDNTGYMSFADAYDSTK